MIIIMRLRSVPCIQIARTRLRQYARRCFEVDPIWILQVENRSKQRRRQLDQSQVGRACYSCPNIFEIRHPSLHSIPRLSRQVLRIAGKLIELLLTSINIHLPTWLSQLCALRSLPTAGSYCEAACVQHLYSFIIGLKTTATPVPDTRDKANLVSTLSTTSSCAAAPCRILNIADHINKGCRCLIWLSSRNSLECRGWLQALFKDRSVATFTATSAPLYVDDMDGLCT